MDSVTTKLEELTAAITAARAMPMSASCVVNRAELLGLLGELRALLPQEITQAQSVLQGREDVLAEGQREAERIVELAHEERRRLLSKQDVLLAAQREADRVLGEAAAGAQQMRAEVDSYVDGKLANFEIILSKTLSSVEHGRAKLAGRDELAEVVERRDEARLSG